MSATQNAIVVFITAPTTEEASRLADVIVEQRLAACVQILPEMQSVYHWAGSIERQTEILLIVKTIASKFDALEKTVREIHSYETPEIVAVPMSAGSLGYIKWLLENVGEKTATN